MMLELLQADGKEVKRKTANEYCSRCPYCGGTDRFIIWPFQGHDGKWWCRQCGRRGDAIQYLRDIRKMSFQEACQYVGKEISTFVPSLSGKRIRTGRRTAFSSWVPRETTPPDDLWQKQAKRLVEESERWLFQPSTFGQEMLKWLKERRGLSEETIKAHRLGLVPIDRFDNYEEWGFEPVLKDNGKLKKIWIPKGLAIPFCQDGKIYRIRIRRPKFAIRSEMDPRYYLLRGSDTRALVLSQHREINVLVESELDAILLSQEAGDLVGVIALGNAQTRPDKEAMEALGNSKLILVALDADDAGAKEAWQWWTKHFSTARRWPPSKKDPGEMFKKGEDLRAWIEAGIDFYQAGIVEPAKAKHKASSKNANSTKSQTRAQPSLDEATRDQEYQPQTPAPEPLGVAEEGIASPKDGRNAAPDVTAGEEADYIGQKSQASERTRTCYDCGYFRPAVNSPNPTQAWGHCRKRNKGRFGVAKACEAVLKPDGDLEVG